MRVIRSTALVLSGATLMLGVAGARLASAAPAAPALLPTPGAWSAHAAANPTPTDEVRRALALHQQAMDAVAARKWRRAASLLHRAAALHPADDPRGITCLELAANFLFLDGDLDGAQEALETAGDRALARGDVASAADAFLKAGLVAREHGDREAASTLVQRARLLANSPHLGETQRSDILSRIVER